VRLAGFVHEPSESLVRIVSHAAVHVVPSRLAERSDPAERSSSARQHPPCVALFVSFALLVLFGHFAFFAIGHRSSSPFCVFGDLVDARILSR
jgi:hypothetical protein